MTYNFSDSQAFKPISQAAQRLLKDAGKATRFTASIIAEFFPYGAEVAALHVAGTELVDAGYASTSGNGGGFEVRLTPKGAALSRHLSS